MPKNPIDPATGRPRRGRPPKIQPVDTIAGPQPTEEAVRLPRPPATVAPADPADRAVTELQQEWKRRHKAKKMLDVPDEYLKAYPDGDFCFARNTADGVSDYRANFDYEVAKLPDGTSLPGQSDSTFKFHDVVLMVRPKWMRKAHDELNRERVLEQMGGEVSSQAEREATNEARGTVRFLREEEQSDDPDDPHFLQEARSRLDGERPAPRTRLAGGTKYVSGGFNK